MTMDEIEEYLRKHIPYSIRIMLSHIEFRRKYYPNIIDDNQILEGVFVGSISKGRMLLEAMGIKLNLKGTELNEVARKNDKTQQGKDIWADDLNGTLVDVVKLKNDSLTEYESIKQYLIAANKYELHLTAQDISRDLSKYNEAIPTIVKLIDDHFYSSNPSNTIIRTELIASGILPKEYFN